MGLLAPFLVLVAFLGVLAILVPGGFKSVVGFIPDRDEAVDQRSGSGGGPRGVVLVALAAGTIVESSSTTANPDAGAMFLIAVVVAMFFRFAPGLTGFILGALATLAALHRTFGAACGEVFAERRWLAIVLVLAGLIGFVLLRILFRGAGTARGRAATPLVLFGIVTFAMFVAGPFGLSLLELTEGTNLLVVIFGGFALIIAAAALLPEFTTSVLGVAVLVAVFTTTSVVDEPCTPGLSLVIVTLAGFGVVWAIARRFAGRGT